MQMSGEKGAFEPPAAAASERHICQVALTCLNGANLREWYAEVFGLVKSGKALFFPPASSRVQGVPGAWEKCSWLIDRQDYFQLEFFQFWHPRTKLRPADWRPCDIGYNMMGIAVSDFDQALRKASALSGTPGPAVVGAPGDRRACVADPEGNLVEIYERDPLEALCSDGLARPVRPEVPAAVRTMRVSVPSLEDARQAYGDAMGLTEVEGFQLHSAEDEALWGLPGAALDSMVLRGANFLLELVQYRSPEARPWPADYSLADQGYMNIALGYRNREEYDRAFDRAVTRGMTANGEVVDIGVFRVMYVNDRQGFSVEMLNARRLFWSVSGFKSREPYVEVEIDIDAPADRVWRLLTDHAGFGDWSLFSGRILRQGRDDPGSVGCIRELSAPGLRITEEITGWHPGRHYTYRLCSGAPFSKHRGDVFVEEISGRTRVRWAIRFQSWLPFTGWLTAGLLQWVFRRGLQTLKARLEG